MPGARSTRTRSLEAILEGLLLRGGRDERAPSSSRSAEREVIEPQRASCYDEWERAAEREKRVAHAVRPARDQARRGRCRARGASATAIGAGVDVAPVHARRAARARRRPSRERPDGAVDVDLARGARAPSATRIALDADRFGPASSCRSATASLPRRAPTPSSRGSPPTCSTPRSTRIRRSVARRAGVDPHARGRHAGRPRCWSASASTCVTRRGDDERRCSPRSAGSSPSPARPRRADVARRRRRPRRCSTAEPDGNVAPEQAAQLRRARHRRVPDCSRPQLDRVRRGACRASCATRTARVRDGARLTRRAVRRRAAAAVDVLGVYVFLPTSAGVSDGAPPAASSFTTIRTEGGAPARRPARSGSPAATATSAGSTPADYHLAEGERAQRGDHPHLEPARRRLGGASSDGRAELPERTTRRRRSPASAGCCRCSRSSATAGCQPRGRVEIDGQDATRSATAGATASRSTSSAVDVAARPPHQGRRAAPPAQRPHGLVQELLNRSDERLWGFVSNGRTLRLLRDNASLTRQAYVEFDLEAMFDGEVYADFVAALARLPPSRGSRARRPTTCWLERWTQEAAERRAPARSTSSATASRRRSRRSAPASSPTRPTATCATRSASGELDRQDYYRELLRLVYRLLFLFVAEDRDLLLDPERRPSGPRALRPLLLDRPPAPPRRAPPGHPARRPLAGPAPRHGRARRRRRLPRARPAGARRLPVRSAEALPAPRRGRARRTATCSTRSARWPRSRSAASARSVDYRNLGAEELGWSTSRCSSCTPSSNADAGTFALDDRRRQRAQDDRQLLHADEPDQRACSTRRSTRCSTRPPRSPIPRRRILDARRSSTPPAARGHFLVAAAHRIAKRLAAVRTGDDEPAPDGRPHAPCATSSAAASTASTSTRWPSSSARSASGWRRSSPASRCRSSTPTSSAATACSARPRSSSQPGSRTPPSSRSPATTRRSHERWRSATQRSATASRRCSRRRSPIPIARSRRRGRARSTHCPTTTVGGGRARRRPGSRSYLDVRRPTARAKARARRLVRRVRRTARSTGLREITTARVRAHRHRTPIGRQAPSASRGRRLASEYGFFHWPLEFPAVFASAAGSTSCSATRRGSG